MNAYRQIEDKLNWNTQGYSNNQMKTQIELTTKQQTINRIKL